jgi:hypothetical protein
VDTVDAAGAGSPTSAPGRGSHDAPEDFGLAGLADCLAAFAAALRRRAARLPQPAGGGLIAPIWVRSWNIPWSAQWSAALPPAKRAMFGLM